MFHSGSLLCLLELQLACQQVVKNVPKINHRDKHTLEIKSSPSFSTSQCASLTLSSIKSKEAIGARNSGSQRMTMMKIESFKGINENSTSSDL